MLDSSGNPITGYVDAGYDVVSTGSPFSRERRGRAPAGCPAPRERYSAGISL
jgi:hypothetical protein